MSARRGSDAWDPHVALEQRAFAYAQTIGLDSAEDPGSRAEHDQARVGNIAAQFAQNQQSRSSHAALDSALLGNHHQFAGADLTAKITLDSHGFLKHQASRDVDIARDRDSRAF